MHRRRPLALPRTVVPLVRAAPLLAFALLLAACGAPATPPGLQLTLGTTSVAVVRGTNADVQVDLTRVGGAADDVDLSVSGLPANVTGSFAPATLSGGTLTSTLTLTVGAGATGGITVVTVTATSGSLSDDATLSLEVTSLTVTGRVETALSRPLSGATVAAQGQTAFTSGTGDFTLAGLSVPYDLTVSSPADNGALHVYEGLSTTSLLLRPAFVAGLPAAPAFGATISGSVVGGALGADEVAIVCVEGLAVHIYGCDTLATGESAYTIDALWFDGAAVSAQIHAVRFTIDADDVPTAYLGYATVAANLDDGSPYLADLDFDPVTASTLTGTNAKPAALTNAALAVALRFGPNLSMPITTFTHLASDFQVLVPDIAGLTYDVLYAAGDASNEAYTWKTDIGLDAGELLLTEVTEPVTPADGATDVDLTTEFTTTSAGGTVRTYIWEAVGSGPSIALTSTRANVTIPDPASAGFAFPAGLDYSWSVRGHGLGDVEEAAAGGIADFTRLTVNILNELGGPGFDGDRTYAVSDDARSLTFVVP